MFYQKTCLLLQKGTRKMGKLRAKPHYLRLMHICLLGFDSQPHMFMYSFVLSHSSPSCRFCKTWLFYSWIFLYSESWSFLRDTLTCINFSYQTWKLRRASSLPSIFKLLITFMSHINNVHAALGRSVWTKSMRAAGLLMKIDSQRLNAASETHLKLSLLSRSALENISAKRQWNSLTNMPTAVLSHFFTVKAGSCSG